MICTRLYTKNQTVGGFGMNSEYSKIVRTYEKVEKDALKQTDNPHELVSIMFQALIKSMSLKILIMLT